MKKILPIISILIGLFFFAICFIIPTRLDKIPDFYADYGFIISAYLSLIFFSIGMLKLKKQG